MVYDMEIQKKAFEHVKGLFLRYKNAHKEKVEYK